MGAPRVLVATRPGGTHESVFGTRTYTLKGREVCRKSGFPNALEYVL
jgi:hypothetical protein